jgi:hypothetical protein
MDVDPINGGSYGQILLYVSMLFALVVVCLSYEQGLGIRPALGKFLVGGNLDGQRKKWELYMERRSLTYYIYKSRPRSHIS